MTPRRTLNFIVMLAAATVAAAPAPAAETTPKPPRTLDAITIEGDIDAPQVQFITSRDRLRFADDAGRRYRPDALAVLAALKPPTRLRILAAPGCPGPESIPLR